MQRVYHSVDKYITYTKWWVRSDYRRLPGGGSQIYRAGYDKMGINLTDKSLSSFLGSCVQK